MHFVVRRLPPSHLDERPHDAPHHVVQKTVADHVEADVARVFSTTGKGGERLGLVPQRPTGQTPDGNLVDRPDAGKLVGPVAFVPAKVVSPQKGLHRIVHGNGVERNVVMPGILVEKREGCRVVVHEIAIAFAFCLKSRVKRERDLIDFQNRDIRRQVTLQTESKAVGGNSGIRFEIGDLADRMDPRVGSARTFDEGFLAGHREDRPFEFPRIQGPCF